jgi:hypothetical protein
MKDEVHVQCGRLQRGPLQHAVRVFLSSTNVGTMLGTRLTELDFCLCRYIAELPAKWDAHLKRSQDAGHSGALGGFAEEKLHLAAAATEIMPEDHRLRGNLNMMMQRISINAQWPWHYKLDAVQRAARSLLIADKDVEQQ